MSALLLLLFAVGPSTYVLAAGVCTNTTRLQLEIADLRAMVNEQNFQIQQSAIQMTELRSSLLTAQQQSSNLEEQNMQLTREKKQQNKELSKFINKCKEIARGLDTVVLQTGEYYFSTISLSWFAAMRFCKQRGLELASVTQDDAGEALGSEIRTRYGDTKNQGKDFWWLSGTDMQTEGQYFWLATGRDVDWDTLGQQQNEQKNNDVHCIALARHGNVYHLNTKLCVNQARFICEIPSLCAIA